MATGLKLSPRAKIVTVAILAAAVVVFLFAIRDILGPFVWAAIVAYIFNPLVTAIARRARVPRFWGVALLYAIGAGVVLWAITYVAPPLRREADQLQRDFPSLISALIQYLLGSDHVEILGYQIDPNRITLELSESAERIAEYVGGHAVPMVFGAIGFVTKLLMFLFVTFYLLLEADRIGAWIQRAIPPVAREEIVALGASADHLLGRWVRGQLLLIVIMSSATWAALTALGMPYAIILAIMTGFLEIFPIVGPVLAGAIACTVALFQPNPFGWNSLTYVVVIAGVYTVLRYAEDYFVIPNVIGRIVQFHPLVVFFALFAGGSVAGILGMFVAVPAMAVLRIILVYVYGKIVEAPEDTAVGVSPPGKAVPEGQSSSYVEEYRGRLKGVYGRGKDIEEYAKEERAAWDRETAD